MNKKLFSWKALAGLALLVAMGMTSCKNTTEVDPNDPYNTTKPVKPGTSTAGDADLTFTLTNASGGDLTSLWNAWKKNNAEGLKKQRHIAKWIYDRLVEETGFTRGKSTARAKAHELKQLMPSAFRPLLFDPGEVL